MTVIDGSWYRKPPDAPVHDSAGGVVARIEGGRVLVALGCQDGYSLHVLPKGHVEPGETAEQAARREIEEEAGFSDLDVLDDFGIHGRLDFRKQAWKRTHYFLFLTSQVAATPSDSDRHDPPAWFDLDALPEIFWPEQRDLIVENRERIRTLVLRAGDAAC